VRTFSPLTPSRRPVTARPSRAFAGFTLVELLVVIGIIAVLAAVLVPVISKVRVAAQDADSRNFINNLQAAVERYYNDFRAYPGPLPSAWIGPGSYPTAAAAVPTNVTTSATAGVTGAENLYLGLVGGLRVATGQVIFDSTICGQGPNNLNPASPRRTPAYVDNVNVSGGKFLPQGAADATFGSGDTEIPEFLDRYAEPLPILYLRANVGASSANNSATDNPIVTATRTAGAQYSLLDIVGYTGSGTGSTFRTGGARDIDRSEYSPALSAGQQPYHGLFQVGTPASAYSLGTNYPYDAYGYFRNSKLSTPTARAKDGYILISAGKDRVYGTRDDITSFGAIGN
jgi:prepilin-type N-terminal cleavage/methylation domain-containing protein